MSIAVMRHALDIAGSAMKDAIKFIDDIKAENASLRKAISELEQRSIAEAEKQEPVAWMYQCSADSSGPCFMQHKTNWAESGSGLWTETPLYIHPPKRDWVGLTDEEIDQGLLRTPYSMKTAEAWREGVRWAYHQLKEKNT